MRNAKKVLAYLLIFSLVVALFAGLNIYNENVDQYQASAGFNVADATKTLKVVRIGNASGALNMNTFVKNEFGEDHSATVTDLTVADVDTDAGKNAINSAELIIIDADKSAPLSWSGAKTIFKKIAGVDTAPAKFLMNAAAYSNGVNSDNTLKNNSDKSEHFYYHLADDDLAFSQDTSESDNGAYVISKGSDSSNMYKLFLLLNTYENPATLYSLFFENVTTQHGILDDGTIIGWGDTVPGGQMLGENKQYKVWSAKILKPFFYMNDINQDLSSIGYRGNFEAGTQINEYSVTILKGYYYWNQYGGVWDNNLGRHTGAWQVGRYDEGQKKYINDSNGQVIPEEITVESREKTGKSAYYNFGSNGGYYIGDLSILFADETDDVDTAAGFREALAGLITAAKQENNVSSKEKASILIVQPNGDMKGTLKVNESIALQILAKYKANGIAPIGGLVVDVMSMYEFNSTIKNINGVYDVIYFGAEEDDVYKTVKEGYGFSTVYAAGKNDLSANMNTKLATYRGLVLASKDLKDKTSSSTVIGAYVDSLADNRIDTNNDFSSVLNTVYNYIRSNNVTITMYESPIKYDAENYFAPNSENSVNDYFYKGQNITEADYINGNGRSREMKFDFIINGVAGSSYTVNLYLDLSGDGLYDPDTEHYATATVSANTRVKSTESGSPIASFKNVIPAGYVGAVPWKLEVVSGGKVVDSVLGMSACKKDSDSKSTINILQIVADGDYGKYTSSDTSYVTTSFLIPTDAELDDAKYGHRNDTKKLITEYDAKSADGLDGIKSYFSNYIQVPVKVYTGSGNHSIATYKDEENKTQTDGLYKTRRVPYSLTDSNNDGASLIYNSGLFYYFMEQLDDYEIHCTRVSLYELQHIFEYQKDKANKTPVTMKYKSYTKNDAGQIVVEEKTYTAAVRYDANTGDIYYTDSKGKTNVKCDLLVSGFADTMVRDKLYVDKVGGGMSEEFENVYQDTADMIAGYISKDHFSLIGHGIVSTRKTETLTAAVRGPLGMTSDYTLAGASGIGNGGNAQEYRVNEGSVTKFPYNVPNALNATNAWQAVYKLNASDEKIAGYFAGAAITRGSGAADSALGDIIGNYYLYKRGNMTYANMGFNEGNEQGQKATTFKLPEAVLLVNTIVNAAQPPAPAAQNPNVVPTNPGVPKSTKPFIPLDEDGNPLDETTKNTYHFYVDYEVSQSADGEPSYDSSAMKDPYIIVGEDGKVYQRVKFNVTNGPATVEFVISQTYINETTHAPETIKITLDDFDVYKYADRDKSDKSPVVELDGGSTEYYVDIPINNSYYNGLSYNGGTFPSVMRDKFGLDNNNNSFTVQVISTSVDDPTKKGYDDFVIARRGMFLIN